VAVASAGPYANHLCLSPCQITAPVPHHSVFYMPDALRDAQPTVSKHRSRSSSCNGNGGEFRSSFTLFQNTVKILSEYYLIHTYSRPRIALAIAEDCYILLVLFLPFSVHRFFRRPQPILSKICHTTQYDLTLIMLCGVLIYAP